MRTTLTLDDDLASRLKRLAGRSGRPFREVVNEAIRKGLAAQEIAEPAAPYRVETFRSGLRAGIDPLKLNQLVDDLEVAESAPEPAGRRRR